MDTAKVKANGSAEKAHVGDAASHLMDESKKWAYELYEEGVHRMADVQKNATECAKEYSNEMVHAVRKNPLASIAIAAGIGFVLSALLRKK